MTDRAQLRQELEAAAAQVASAIEGLTDEQASRPAPDDWSAKDHLAHLTLWHEMRFFEVARIARGGRASFPATDEAGVEQINEQFVANRRPLPLAQVIADLQFARGLVLEAIANASEDRLDLRHFEEMGPNGAGHEMEHARLIREWRQKAGI